MNREGMVLLDTARWRLAVVWFLLCGVLVVILIGQSLSGTYEAHLGRLWGWALPNFLPTIALMVSVFAADAMKDAGSTQNFVRLNFVKLSIGMSIFYFLVLYISFLSPQFVGFPVQTEDVAAARLGRLEQSHLWLAPIQSLTIAVMGVLFFLKQEEPK